MSSIKQNIKSLGSKSGVSVVGWLLVLGALLYFGSYFFKKISNLFGITRSEEDKAEESQQKKDLTYLQNKYREIYKLTSKSKSYFEKLANDIEQDFNGVRTDWTKQWNFISGLTDMDLVALYLNFGVRYNTEFSNMWGDLPAWIDKEDAASPLDFFKGSSVKKIKDKWYRVSGIIASANRFKGLN